MRGERQNLAPDDLFLLAASLARPGDCTLASLCAHVLRLTGRTTLTSETGDATPLDGAVADWQLTALAQGLLKTTATAASARHEEPAVDVTATGMQLLQDTFGATLLERARRDGAGKVLVARALGLPPNAGPQRLKRLDTAAGLRLAIVRRAWQLRVPESATAGQVRNALAARALGEAFGRPVERQVGVDHRMSGKAGRAIAAQLLDRKRRISTDAQLITALAAQHLDVTTGDVRTLRQALVGRHFACSKKVQSRADTATLDGAAHTTPATPAAMPPTPAFLKAVRTSAKLNANGWSGNRKAYISHVWRSVCDSHPDWRLDATTFKAMLADAHREGQVVLVNADLRDKKNMRDIQDSAVQYKYMEWHYVQIGD